VLKSRVYSLDVVSAT